MSIELYESTETQGTLLYDNVGGTSVLTGEIPVFVPFTVTVHWTSARQWGGGFTQTICSLPVRALSNILQKSDAGLCKHEYTHTHTHTYCEDRLTCPNIPAVRSDTHFLTHWDKNRNDSWQSHALRPGEWGDMNTDCWEITVQTDELCVCAHILCQLKSPHRYDHRAESLVCVGPHSYTRPTCHRDSLL